MGNGAFRRVGRALGLRRSTGLLAFMRGPESKLDPIGSFVEFIFLDPEVCPPSRGAFPIPASSSPASLYYSIPALLPVFKSLPWYFTMIERSLKSGAHQVDLGLGNVSPETCGTVGNLCTWSKNAGRPEKL